MCPSQLFLHWPCKVHRAGPAAQEGPMGPQVLFLIPGGTVGSLEHGVAMVIDAVTALALGRGRVVEVSVYPARNEETVSQALQSEEGP